jgi:hypothetical protein
VIRKKNESVKDPEFASQPGPEKMLFVIKFLMTLNHNPVCTPAGLILKTHELPSRNKKGRYVQV